MPCKLLQIQCECYVTSCRWAAYSSFAFQNFLEFFKGIFLIYGWLNSWMWNSRIWRANCALIWTALGDFSTRFWRQLIRSGETWTLGVISVTKSSQRSRHKGSFWRMISLSNHAEQGVSFPPKAHFAPGSSSGQTLVWVPGNTTISSELFCKVSFWEDTAHCVITASCGATLVTS